MKNRFSFVILILILFSCQKEENRVKPDVSTNLQISVEVEMPKEVTLKSANPENDISSFDILIFDENKKFIERKQVDSDNISAVSNSNNTIYSFFTDLNNSTEARHLHFIANARNADNTNRVNFGIVQPGDDMSRITKLRTSAITSPANKNQVLPHVMWGVLNLSSIDNSVAIPRVKLIRSMASVTLQVASGIEQSRFSLMALTACSATPQGSVTPTDVTQSNTLPTSPNTVNGRVNYINISNGSGYWADAVENKCRDLYIYESTGADIWTGGVSFIVKAKYNGQQCFYRVSPQNAEVAVKYLRNRRYILTITRVDGKGYDTVERAFYNPPSNLGIEITDESEFSNVITDGRNILAATANSLHLYINKTKALPVLKLKSTYIGAVSVACQNTSLELENRLDPIETGVSNVFMYNGVAFSSLINDEILINDGISGHNLQIPLLINPANTLLSTGDSFEIPSENLNSWEVILPDDFPHGAVKVEMNGSVIPLNNKHYIGNNLNSLTFLARKSLPAAGQYVSILLKGIKPNKKVVTRTIILQVGEA